MLWEVSFYVLHVIRASEVIRALCIRKIHKTAKLKANVKLKLIIVAVYDIIVERRVVIQCGVYQASNQSN